MFLDKRSPPSPERIISLVPSQTELLYHLGLENETTGITKFCVHPEQWFRTKTRIGGTKQLDIKKIISLQPDLIIANKEENVKEQIEELAEKFPVWLTDVNSFEEALQMIKDVSRISGKNENGINLIEDIKEKFDSLKDEMIPACYLIWKDPYMTVGGDTFISDMMKLGGFQNVFSYQKRYPEVSVEKIHESGCKLILLSSEPFPFKEKHAEELKAKLPGIKIIIADGEMFSWYGSRMLLAPAYFQQLRNVVNALTDV